MNLTRREFLDNSILAAAATLAASTATPAEQPAPARTRVGPNEKIRVAVIGVNGQGGEHLKEWLKLPDVDLVAVCDCDPAAYQKRVGLFKDLKRKPRYVQDLRKLFEDKSIDAVSIATPNHWHALMAVWAMQAGKDVYVEKPCSHNVHEGRVITQWARKLGRICQMGVQSRSMTGMRQTLDFIKSGKIGKVSVARAICYRSRPSIGKTGTEAPSRRGWISTSGVGLLLSWCRSASDSITIGTGSGPQAMATWAIRTRTSWTRPAGPWASRNCPSASSAWEAGWAMSMTPRQPIAR